MKQLFYLLILTISFSACNTNTSSNEEKEKINSTEPQKNKDMKDKMSIFLTFQENNAEEAMNFYVSLFKDAKVLDVQRYHNHEYAKEGSIMKATFELNGINFACSDSFIKHAWSFTPAVSVFVDVDTEDELKRLFGALSEGGKVLMPVDNYGFSEKFAFVEDRFGISWQLNME